MNKLSELSKPVAYDYQIAGACIADGHNENGKWVDWNNKLSRYCPPDWMVEEGKVTELKPLYSQEYVSALLEDNERVARDLVARNGEIEGLRKRVAELEAKLATPVRLKKVDSSNVPYAGDGFNAAVDYCADRVRAAGFTVQGDE
ncbi:hypothetical protein [Serratia marcescens]|uniref:hypothetical protein n=1 Tax=Serratia marcescens TaxID=615 RepID=UPI003FA77281